jgi:predicted ATPase
MIKPPYLRLIDIKNTPQRVEDYPFNLDVFQNPDFKIEFTKAISIFTGENGSGKSTILEIIADHCGFNPVGGNADQLLSAEKHIGDAKQFFRFSWSLRLRAGFFLRAESFGVFATFLDEMAREEGAGLVYRPWGGRSLNRRSHGEAFLTLFSKRLHNKGVYILDEPEAALSPSRQFELLRILRHAESIGQSQIIMATHSPILLSYKSAEIFEISGKDIDRKLFRETKNYQLYSNFMKDPGGFPFIGDAENRGADDED